MAWEICNINTVASVWDYASAERVAGYCNAHVARASTLGIATIYIHPGYVSIDIDTSQVDAPVVYWDDCNYCMIGLNFSGYYNTTMKMCIVSIASTATYVTNFGGGDGGCYGQWLVTKTDEFAAFKQTASNVNNVGIFVYDELTDLATGDTVRVVLSRGNLFDLDHGIATIAKLYDGIVVAETDGTTFVEVAHIMYADKTDGTGSHIYQSHLYSAMYDYDSNVDKTILINGVKMNRMDNSYLYVPVE